MKIWTAVFVLLACACSAEDASNDALAGADASDPAHGEMIAPTELDKVSHGDLSASEANIPAAELDAVAPALGDDAEAAKKVVGTVDSRSPVLNTKDAPYRTIVALFPQFPGEEYAGLCTGSMIAPNAVLTAAHCVYDRRTGHYAKTTQVVPATQPDAHNNVTTPFGTTYAIKGYVTDAYKAAKSDWESFPQDFAVIVLKDALGQKTGVRMFGTMPGQIEGRRVQLDAYQDDKFVTNRAGAQAYVMHESTDQVRKSYAGIFNHYADSHPGSSGGPLVSNGDFADTIFALHIAGPRAQNGYYFNIGVALDASKVDTIRGWLRK